MKGEEHGGHAMRNERRIGSRLFMALVFLFLYAPIFVLIVFSFNEQQKPRRLDGIFPGLVPRAVPGQRDFECL